MKRIPKILLVTTGAVAVLLGLSAIALSILFSRDLYVPEPGPAPELVIRGGLLFDAASETARENPGIVLRQGVIACVGADCPAGPDAREIDATGLAILPGLIDLHVHFLAVTGDNADLGLPGLIWNLARMRPDVRRKLLEAGVTSIRDVGGPQDVMLDLKTMLDTGELAGPRLFIVGAMITAPGGHPAYGGRDPNTMGFGGNMAFQSDDPDTVRREVERQAARGVDGIKVVYHGATSDAGEVLLPTLSEATASAAIETARAHGLWVAVHVGAGDEAGAAAELGATTVEHGVRNGNRVSEATLTRLVEREVVYVPTLGREPQGHLNIPALYAAGVAIGVGTDTNNPEMSYGESYHRELARLAAAGMPPAAVLAAATRHAARGLGAATRLGTVETGKLADVLLVRGTPWRNLQDLRDIEMVIQGGRIVVDRSGG